MYIDISHAAHTSTHLMHTQGQFYQSMKNQTEEEQQEPWATSPGCNRNIKFSGKSNHDTSV